MSKEYAVIELMNIEKNEFCKLDLKIGAAMSIPEKSSREFTGLYYDGT